MPPTPPIVKKKPLMRSYCRYCGASKTRAELTNVPFNRYTVFRWSKILGRSFFENVKAFATNTICKSHFDNERRGRYDLPKKMEDDLDDQDEVTMEEVNEVEKFTGDKLISGVKKEVLTQPCHICGEICEKDLMTSVPRKSKWVLILKMQCNPEDTFPVFVCARHFVNINHSVYVNALTVNNTRSSSNEHKTF
ncbi:unnamed protein product [Caenorhabditis angaria]|uniref:THAP-type domain-containing protein n=1 Tax=Caenorhabditis angaria TaxID=860376 RepID=A0A9P1I750_9PELO|nr:unnamed protein product [Caenorhabditis angaria]